MNPRPILETMQRQRLCTAHVMRKTFAKWALGDACYESARTDLAATTLEEAVAICTPGPIKASLAKGGFGSFVILETDDTARVGKARHILHFYTVKARRDWRRIGDYGEAVQAAIPYAVHSGSLPMDAFEPRRPFDARHDDPANGRQPHENLMIEVRP